MGENILLDDLYTHIESENIDPHVKKNNQFVLQELTQTKVSKELRNLQNFFKENPKILLKSGDSATNIINVAEKKCYGIYGENLEEFFKKIDECRKNNVIMHYGEKQLERSGIMIDIDRYQSSSERQITNIHFQRFATKLLGILQNIVDTSPLKEIKKDNTSTANNQNIIRGKVHDKFKIFFITRQEPTLETEKESKKGYYKDGFHVLIPEIWINREVKKYILNQIKTEHILDSVFGDIENSFPPDEMLDLMSASVPVLFYGCSKIQKYPYKLSLIIEAGLDSHTNELSIRQQYTENFLYIHAQGEIFEFPEKINLTYELSLNFYMSKFDNYPTWLIKQNYEPASSLTEKIRLFSEKHSFDRNNLYNELIENDNSVSILTLHDSRAKYLKSLLDILDISYANNYDKWFKVLCAIANTSHTYKELAKCFSLRKPDSWNSSEFDRVWNEAINIKCRGEPVTLRSIIHWAKESNPEQYLQIKSNHYQHLLSVYARTYDGRIEHAMVANIIHAMHSDKFVVGVNYNSSDDKCYWYEFVVQGQSMKKGEVWKWRREGKIPHTLHLMISEHLPKVYKEVSKELRECRDTAQEDHLIKYWGKVEQKFKESELKLFNTGYQNGIINQSIHKFLYRGWFDELDSQSDIIGVGNGVLKLGIEPSLIRGFHDYKISLYTPVDYVPYDPNNIYIKMVESALRDIFPENDVYEYMMMYTSVALEGNTALPYILFLVGGGCNGKSFYVKITKRALGKLYSYKGPVTLLTSDYEESSSANSAYSSIENKRFVYFSEPTKSMELNEGRIKDMTGQEDISTRELYAGQKNFEPKCVFVSTANHDFIIKSTDHGIWRRVQFYRCKTKFVHNPDPNNKYEKKMDQALIREHINDPNWQQAMLSILVHYNIMLRTKYRHNLENVPKPTITHETELYRNRQDTFNRYITEMIVKSPNGDDCSLNIFASKYNTWYFNCFHTVSGITIDNVETQLENSRLASYLYRLDNDAYILRGIRILDSPDDNIYEDEVRLLSNKHKSKKISLPEISLGNSEELEELENNI
jgi:hypothetical protein